MWNNFFKRNFHRFSHRFIFYSQQLLRADRNCVAFVVRNDNESAFTWALHLNVTLALEKACEHLMWMSGEAQYQIIQVLYTLSTQHKLNRSIFETVTSIDHKNGGMFFFEELNDQFFFSKIAKFVLFIAIRFCIVNVCLPCDETI